MLTRLRFRRDFRVIVRCLSDKPTDGPPHPPEAKSEHDKPKNTETKLSTTDKINELLKKMVEENQKKADISEDFPVAPGIPKRRKPKGDEIEVKTEKIEESITKAAGAVAEAIGGDVKQTEAELLSKVLGKISQNSTSLSDLILGMKVDRSKDTEESQPETRGQQVKRLVTQTRQENQTRYQQRQRSDEYRERQPRSFAKPQVATVDIFSGSPLGIFKTPGTNYGTKLDTWEDLKQRELTLATAQPPANYFQKMVVWTKQGKVWKFPVDNEQGFEEERSVHFSEHIFLDVHLEGWCPTKGPIRHFMELVCVGLSKNPFYTVQEKKDHIMWYKEYFESKKDILNEVGVWDNVGKGKNKEASA